MKAAQDALTKGELSGARLRQIMEGIVAQTEGIELDYATVVDPMTLEAAIAVPDLSGDVDVRTVLQSLDPVHRAVLVLRHLDGLDEREMANVLDVAPGTVKSRLHRARTAFRARWSA